MYCLVVSCSLVPLIRKQRGRVGGDFIPQTHSWTASGMLPPASSDYQYLGSDSLTTKTGKDIPHPIGAHIILLSNQMNPITENNKFRADWLSNLIYVM